MLRRRAVIVGCSILIGACTNGGPSDEPPTQSSTVAVTTTGMSTMSTRPYEPVLLSLEPEVDVSAVDAMSQSQLWSVERRNGRIIISISQPTDFEQRESVSLSFADAASPRLLDASTTVQDAMAQSERTAAIRASNVHLVRFDPNGVIAGTLRTSLGRELRYWVDMAVPFIVTGIGGYESPVTMDLSDHVIVQWHELSVQLIRVDGCRNDNPSAVIYLHGLDRPWYTPGERDQVLQSGAAPTQATIGTLDHSYTYDLEAEVECTSPPAVHLTAGIADWTPR